MPEVEEVEPLQGRLAAVPLEAARVLRDVGVDRRLAIALRQEDFLGEGLEVDAVARAVLPLSAAGVRSPTITRISPRSTRSFSRIAVCGPKSRTSKRLSAKRALAPESVAAKRRAWSV